MNITLVGGGGLMGAIANRRRIGQGPRENLVLPLRGGSGAFVKSSASRRLVTIVTRADAEAPPGGIAGWLEKRQARRSALLVVPDRSSGVAIALRWRLNPERFRLAADFDVAATDLVVSETTKRRPWHSRG